MKTRWLASLAVLSAAILLRGQDAIGAGTYKGEWHGASGGGEIHLTFRADGKPEAGFTLDSQEVACKVLSFKPDGAKFKLVYEFDLQGNVLQSAIEGTVKGKTIEGTYKTTAGDQDVDAGTWKASAP
jgi:hypothetical protein